MRVYMRSSRFRVLSWTSSGVLIACFVFTQYRVRLLYVALALSTAAMLPLMPSIRQMRETKVDLHNKRDRNSVLFVMCFIGLLLAATIVLVLYRR